MFARRLAKKRLKRCEAGLCTSLQIGIAIPAICAHSASCLSRVVANHVSFIIFSLGILKEFSHLVKLYSRKFLTFNDETLSKFDFLLIEQLLVSAMQLVSPVSVSGSSLYTYVPDDEPTSKKINIYKANYISIFSSVLKAFY